MRVAALLFVVLIVAVGCGQTEPPSQSAARPNSEVKEPMSAEDATNEVLADLPEWIIEAHSSAVVQDRMLDLGFYGDKRIDDARALELLAKLANLNRLEFLDSLCVTESPISDKSFSAWGKMAQQGRLKRLRYIGFGGTHVGDSSSTEWARAAQSGQLESLETLQLFNTQISDNSMIEWAEAAQQGKLTNLNELWLIETSVGDESMTAWAKAAQAGYLTKLERLALCKTQVSGKTLEEWAEAADAGKLPNLITFWLNDTNVTAIDNDGQKVPVPAEYLVIGRAQDLFAWVRNQRE